MTHIRVSDIMTTVMTVKKSEFFTFLLLQESLILKHLVAKTDIHVVYAYLSKSEKNDT